MKSLALPSWHFSLIIKRYNRSMLTHEAGILRYFSINFIVNTLINAVFHLYSF